MTTISDVVAKSMLDLARYTPRFLNRHLQSAPAAPESPGGDTADAVVLWCDISGFTPLTEKLVAAGPGGVESLTEYLNVYYGRLIDIVQGHGGDVTQFEGDAMLAVWRLDEQGGEPIEDVTLRVARCGLAIQRELHDFHVADDIHLSQRVAIGVGQMRFFWVGGVLSRWTVVVAGAPLVQVQAIDHARDPGEVVVSEAAWALIADRARGEVLPGKGCTWLQAVPEPPPLKPAPVVELSEEASTALRVFLPGAVLNRMRSAGRWLAELRSITVLFVQMPDLDPQAPDVRRTVQNVVEQVQHAVYRWGGSVNKLSLADKGATLLAGFGVPPLAHEDDPVRAVLAARDIVERLARVGVVAGVGVTTGQVFCGLLGNERRCEYATLGSPVNLASRLMQLARGSVLCDEPTWTAAKHRIGFDPQPARKVKGIREPVASYRPTTELQSVRRTQTEIVGRTLELEAISRLLQGVLRRNEGGALVIEGEAGIGKSRLAAEGVRKAEDLQMRVLGVEAHAIERDTPYFAWRELVRELFDLDRDGGRAQWRAQVLARLDDDPELLRLAPLLNEVLPLELPMSGVVEEMNNEARAENLRVLMTRMLQSAADERPLLLFVEDAHWLDSASWALVTAVAADVDPLLVLLATRPFYDATAPADYAGLLARKDAIRLELGSLGPTETIQLVRQRLGVANLPDEVGELLVTKGGGNPFFTEELAYALRDSGRLLIADGTCGLAPGVELDQLELPTTVQGVVVSRVDRLPPEEQLVLKAASVIGREFEQSLLAEIYPIEEARDRLGEMLAKLSELDMVQPEDPTTGLYIFKHALGQDAVYGLMLFSQRRALHRAVAEHFEAGGADAGLYPLLAHHWSRAEDAPKAVFWLQRAGDEAYGRYANREAVVFLERALDMCGKHPDAEANIDKGAVEEHLALAHYWAGDLDHAVRRGERALEYLERPVPISQGKMVLSFLGTIMQRIWQAKGPKRTPLEGDERDRLLAAARLEGVLSEAAAFAQEGLRTLYLALRNLNAAYFTGPTPELGRAYVVASIMLGTIPMAGVADTWAERALEIARGLTSRQHRAWIYARCAIYDLFRARWERLDGLMEQVYDLVERLGDRRLGEETLVSHGLSYAFRGRFLDAEPLMRRLIAAAKASGNEQTVGWGALGLAECLVRTGRPAEGLQVLDDLGDWLEKECSTAERIMGLSMRALAHLDLGSMDAARADADRVYDLYVGTRPVAYFVRNGAPTVVEVYGHLYRADPDAALLRKLKKAAKTARVFGSVFVFGEAAGPYWTGVVHELEGKMGKAVAEWRKAAATADRTGCQLERVLAHSKLAEVETDARARERHADAARQAVEASGVRRGKAEYFPPELETVEGALSSLDLTH